MKSRHKTPYFSEEKTANLCNITGQITFHEHRAFTRRFCQRGALVSIVSELFFHFMRGTDHFTDDEPANLDAALDLIRRSALPRVAGSGLRESVTGRDTRTDEANTATSGESGGTSSSSEPRRGQTRGQSKRKASGS